MVIQLKHPDIFFFYHLQLMTNKAGVFFRQGEIQEEELDISLFASWVALQNQKGSICNTGLKRSWILCFIVFTYLQCMDQVLLVPGSVKVKNLSSSGVHDKCDTLILTFQVMLMSCNLCGNKILFFWRKSKLYIVFNVY